MTTEPRCLRCGSDSKDVRQRVVNGPMTASRPCPDPWHDTPSSNEHVAQDRWLNTPDEKFNIDAILRTMQAELSDAYGSAKTMLKLWSRCIHSQQAEIERLRAKLDPENREPPHCATCGCGLPTAEVKP